MCLGIPGQVIRLLDGYSGQLALVDVADPQHRLIAMKLIEAGGTPPHAGSNG